MKYQIIMISFIFTLIIFLSSCERKSGRRDIQSNKGYISDEQRPSSIELKGKTTIKMIKRGGVYFIPCKINGSEMEFIFDTGASDEYSGESVHLIRSKVYNLILD
jgi:aspartyl protease family protein